MTSKAILLPLIGVRPAYKIKKTEQKKQFMHTIKALKIQFMNAYNNNDTELLYRINMRLDSVGYAYEDCETEEPNKESE